MLFTLFTLLMLLIDVSSDCGFGGAPGMGEANWSGACDLSF